MLNSERILDVNTHFWEGNMLGGVLRRVSQQLRLSQCQQSFCVQWLLKKKVSHSRLDYTRQLVHCVKMKKTMVLPNFVFT